jgi:multidrug efflux pump subunit AcrA (membrane-fusion protein)
MLIRYVIPLLAAIAVGFGLAASIRLAPAEIQDAGMKKTTGQNIPAGERIYGLGILESAEGNVSIISPLSGIIEKVCVHAADKVKRGEPLFIIDGKELKAEMVIKTKQMELKNAELAKIRSGSHPDEIRAAEHRLENAKMRLNQAKDEWNRAQKLIQTNAISHLEHQQKQFAFLAAEATCKSNESELEHLRNLPRPQDVLVAEKELELSKANLERARVDYERAIITAPNDCCILQVNIRSGEYINLAVNTKTHIVLAPDAPLQLRIQVDEDLASLITNNIQVEATIRDRRGSKLKLRFVRVEPIVIPKTSFTGKVAEKLDTRIINIIYEVIASDSPIFIGQQVDVYFTHEEKNAETGKFR